MIIEKKQGCTYSSLFMIPKILLKLLKFSVKYNEMYKVYLLYYVKTNFPFNFTNTSVPIISYLEYFTTTALSRYCKNS